MKKFFTRIILILSILVLIACIAYFVNSYIQKRNVDNLSDAYKVSSSESNQSANTKVDVPVDFAALKKINQDVYAWINVPGTPVDYPILQSEKNEYYLNRNIEKEWSVYGCIFSETYNSKDFSDFNTLLYGHNMKNETMFGSLKRFRDASFFEENRYINVYTENRILKYEIFAACTWDNKHILANRDFSLPENCTAYLEEIFAVRDMNSQVSKEIEVTANDRIITLSTCMNDKTKRFIVSGVLIYDSQNP